MYAKILLFSALTSNGDSSTLVSSFLHLSLLRGELLFSPLRSWGSSNSRFKGNASLHICRTLLVHHSAFATSPGMDANAASLAASHLCVFLVVHLFPVLSGDAFRLAGKYFQLAAFVMLVYDHSGPSFSLVFSMHAHLSQVLTFDQEVRQARTSKRK